MDIIMKNFLNTAPQSLEELRLEFHFKWKNFHRKRDHALTRFSLTDEDREALRILDGLEAGLTAFIASDRLSMWRYAKWLFREYKPLWTADPTLQHLHVTILNEQFHASDQNTHLNIADLKNASRSVLSAMSKDWMGAVEIQGFSNCRHPDGGQLLSPHVHAVVFGHDVLVKAEDIAAKYSQKWSSGETGCDAVGVQLIQPTWLDMARILRYPHKGPDRRKNIYVNPETGRRNINETEKTDRYIRFLRHYQIQSMIEKDSLLFASGRGIGIKNAALRRTHDLLEARTEKSKRADQMDWVNDFWEGFMPRVGMGGYNMPVIDL